MLVARHPALPCPARLLLGSSHHGGAAPTLHCACMLAGCVRRCLPCSQAAASGKPFWLQLNPVAPHTQCTGEAGADKACVFPIPAERHAALFNDTTVPRGVNYATPFFTELAGQVTPWNVAGSVAVADDGSSATNRTDLGGKNDKHYRQRLRSLAAVDEMVASVGACRCIVMYTQRGELSYMYMQRELYRASHARRGRRGLAPRGAQD